LHACRKDTLLSRLTEIKRFVAPAAAGVFGASASGIDTATQTAAGSFYTGGSADAFDMSPQS